MKYKTLAELKQAYDSGELSRDDFLCLDNDSTSVYQSNENEEYKKVFEGETPDDLLREALDLLGIPWENA